MKQYSKNSKESPHLKEFLSNYPEKPESLYKKLKFLKNTADI